MGAINATCLPPCVPADMGCDDSCGPRSQSQRAIRNRDNDRDNNIFRVVPFCAPFRCGEPCGPYPDAPLSCMYNIDHISPKNMSKRYTNWREARLHARSYVKKEDISTAYSVYAIALIMMEEDLLVGSGKNFSPSNFGQNDISEFPSDSRNDIELNLAGGSNNNSDRHHHTSGGIRVHQANYSHKNSDNSDNKGYRQVTTKKNAADLYDEIADFLFSNFSEQSFNKSNSGLGLCGVQQGRVHNKVKKPLPVFIGSDFGSRNSDTTSTVGDLEDSSNVADPSTSYDSGYNHPALLFYDKACHIDEENPDRFYKKGVALQMHEKFRLAIEQFQLAINLKGDHKPARFNLGVAYFNVNAYKDSLRVFQGLYADLEEVTRTEEELQDTVDEKVNLLTLISECHENLCNYEQSLECLQTALSLKPRSRQALRQKYQLEKKMNVSVSKDIFFHDRGGPTYLENTVVRVGC